MIELNLGELETPAKLNFVPEEVLMMNIIQGCNPQQRISGQTFHKVSGVKIVEKSGKTLYLYPDECNSNLDFNPQQTSLLDLNQWEDSFTELDGFYCVNDITHTVNYLGSEWSDVVLGLKFRGLAKRLDKV